MGVQVRTRQGQSLGQIAEQEQVKSHGVGRIVQLARLAPDIVQALEQGEHPAELNATRLCQLVPLPMDWEAQRQVLGLV